MHCDFGHRLSLDRIGANAQVELAADDAERGAIADRLGLRSLERLEANVSIEREGDRIRALGRLRASLQQSCVATGEPVGEYVDEPFEVVFVPEPKATAPDEEVELSHQDCDVVFYEGGAIDLGTAIADSLALSVDPYPRSASADVTLREAGVITEEQASPFAVLAKLKKGGDAS